MQQIRQLTNREIQNEIKSLIGRLGALQTESVIQYELIRNPEQSRQNIDYLLNGLRVSGGAFFSEYNIMPYPNRKIEGDMAIAFWVFTEFAEAAGDRFLAANWPSSIIFRTDDAKRPYRITVCHSPERDENLAVLANKRWDGVFNEIIAGVNLREDEIDHTMLPDGDSVIFVSVMSERMLIDIPKMEKTIVKGGEAND